SGLGRRYDKPFDRESAYEMLSTRATQNVEQERETANKPRRETNKTGSELSDLAGRVVKSALSQAANQLGRQLARGLLGSLLVHRAFPGKAALIFRKKYSESRNP
ncbi:helicase HerA-like domain-containing protein, partial [Acinetobacter baumannii]|uniref:helicase HerA-like domain-containing protein n=1 Tax=Acinetobacter baumannii TaxID=470 RepID=UPI0037702344